MPSDLFWTLTAFFLTILVLSYVLGDNALFRLVMMIFVGVSAGYATFLIYDQILLPRLIAPLVSGSLAYNLLLLVPLILCVLLLFKLFPRLSILGNPSMALLTGVAAAVAVTGAVSGTLFGQIKGTVNPFDVAGLAPGNAFMQVLGGIVLLAGTVTSLAYFHFSARKKDGENTGNQPGLIQLAGKIGQVFIAITLGALFAGVISAALAALIERLDFILTVIKAFISS